MNRFDHLHKTYREAKMKARKERILMMSRSEPNINGSGTSGYTVKSGENTGKVLKHISVTSSNSLQFYPK